MWSYPLVRMLVGSFSTSISSTTPPVLTAATTTTTTTSTPTTATTTTATTTATTATTTTPTTTTATTSTTAPTTTTITTTTIITTTTTAPTTTTIDPRILTTGPDAAATPTSATTTAAATLTSASLTTVPAPTPTAIATTATYSTSCFATADTPTSPPTSPTSASTITAGGEGTLSLSVPSPSTTITARDEGTPSLSAVSTTPAPTPSDNANSEIKEEVPRKWAISEEMDTAVLEVLAATDVSLKLSRSRIVEALAARGLACSAHAHFSRIRGVKCNKKGDLYWLKGTNSQPAEPTDLRPEERAEREQRRKQIDKILEDLTSTLRQSHYNGNTMEKLNQCMAAVETLIQSCMSEHAQGFYARSGFIEVQRVCDKAKMGRFWPKCHKRIRGIVLAALALPHNTESQTKRLQEYLTDCDGVEESEEDSNSADDDGPLTNRLHPQERDLSFWGKGLTGEIVVDHSKLAALSREILQEVARVQPDAEFKLRQNRSLEQLRELVHSIEPAYQVKLFGSVVYGLDTMSSDLDCGIVGCTEERFLRFLNSLALKLKAAPQSYSRVIPIFKGRVPIVRFTDVKNKIDVDVSLLKEDSQLVKTALLVEYRNIDLRFTMLIHLVKQFARANLLGDASMGGLNSFGWTMLVLQFCQVTTPPVLPNLQGDNNTTNFAAPNGWISQNNKDIGTLLLDFFLFYTRQFRPFCDCVSVRSGALIPAAPYRITEEDTKKDSPTISEPAISIDESPACAVDTSRILKYSQAELVALMAKEVSANEVEKVRGLTSVVHRNAKYASTISSSYAAYVRSLLLPSRVGFQTTQRTYLCIEDPVDRTDNVARGIAGVTMEKIYKAMLKAIDVFRSPQLSLRTLFQPIPRVPTRHAIRKQKRIQEEQAKEGKRN